MEIEVDMNKFDTGDWWYDLGISFTHTQYHKYKRVFTISIVIVSIYIRW